MDAIPKRHAYAATDNIALDFQAATGRTAHLMGDPVTAQTKEGPQFRVPVSGTAPIKQIDLN